MVSLCLLCFHYIFTHCAHFHYEATLDKLGWVYTAHGAVNRLLEGLALASRQLVPQVSVVDRTLFLIGIGAQFSASSLRPSSRFSSKPLGTCWRKRCLVGMGMAVVIAALVRRTTFPLKPSP